MFMLGTSWLWVAAWLRTWLRQRLYPHKLPAYYIDNDRVYFAPGQLTFLDQCVVFVLHLIILGAAAGAIILTFLGIVNLAKQVL